MSRIFHRAAALVAGFILPLGAWALVAPASVDDEYAGIVPDAQQVSEASFESIEPMDAIEPETVFGTADLIDQEATDQTTQLGCCVWFYFMGNWYCLQC